MRARGERRLERGLRRLTRGEADRAMVRTARRLQQSGRALSGVLEQMVADPGQPWLHRGTAAALLQTVRPGVAVQVLLRQFLAQELEIELVEIGLALGRLGDSGAIGPLVDALRDANLHRRGAAARALGWLGQPGGRRTVEALSGVLADPGQPVEVRENAAESLGHLYSAAAIPALIAATEDADVRIRFWAVFGLGSLRTRRGFSPADAHIVPALEARLEDRESPPGGWWPVSREALVFLGIRNPPMKGYRERLRAEMERVQSDAGATEGDRRWAEFWGNCVDYR